MDIKRYNTQHIRLCPDGRLAIDTHLFGREFTLYGTRESELLLIANEYARCLIASHNRKMREVDDFWVQQRPQKKLHLTYSAD